ncbi:MAG: TGS domain-containing protein, partial [Oscillospiraceae bacterium]
QESDDVEDILRTIKSDIAPEEVYVFTPRGDVISLPTGSNVIDFAYAIHSAVGNKMIGAKVDGRIVSFDYNVKTGEIVEVLTTKSQNQGPKREWLKIVKTGEARNKIRAWFKKEKREDNVDEGKAELEKEFKRNSIALRGEQLESFILEIAKKQHCDTIDDFFASIGYGGIILSRIMPRIKDEYIKKFRENAIEELSPPELIKPTNTKTSSGVIVDGIDNCLVKFSKCCNPVPGDDIVGFITRGHGVSIHKKDCINIVQSMENDAEKYRLIDVKWEQSSVTETFKSTIEIVATGRNSILADISVALANMRIGIHALNAKELKNTNVFVSVTVAINSLDHLKTIILKLQKIDGVISVQRSNI